MWQPFCHADEPPVRYRFGEWLLLLPAAAAPSALAAGPLVMTVPAAGLEIIAYWQDGKRRAVSLRFDAAAVLNDRVMLRSSDSVNRINGCKLASGGRIPKLDSSKETGAVSEFSDGAALVLAGGERGFKRVGDVLVADLGGARVQITDDSPIVRAGEWDSADFCRFELKDKAAEDE